MVYNYLAKITFFFEKSFFAFFFCVCMREMLKKMLYLHFKDCRC